MAKQSQPKVHVQIEPRREDADHFDDAGIPWVPWHRFQTDYLPEFKQGEHVSIISQTGGGKTTLLTAPGGLLSRYPNIVVCGTKRKDDKLYPPLLAAGYQMTDHPVLNHKKHPKVIFKPKQHGLGDANKQYLKTRFELLLNVIDAQGGWALCLEELIFLTKLGLREEITTEYEQARSNKVTIIAGMQTPAWVPRTALDQVGHVFVLQVQDIDRIKRVAELMPRWKDQVKTILPVLPQFDLLYYRCRDHLLVRTRVLIPAYR